MLSDLVVNLTGMRALMKKIIFIAASTMFVCTGCNPNSGKSIPNSVVSTSEYQNQINQLGSSGVATLDTLKLMASQPVAASSIAENKLPPNELEQVKKYEAAKLAYQAKIDAALIKYRAIPKTSDVRPLIELDKELTAISKTDPGETRDLFKKEYEEIGFDIVGSYGLEYTGGLLIQAHKLNPNSPYREDTLFAKLMAESDDRSDDKNEVRLEPIYEYLKEYPYGKHAATAYMQVADDYRDLYRVLWEFSTDDRSKGGYGYKCYAHFVTKEPYPEQMNKARVEAIKNYQMAQKYVAKDDEYSNKKIAIKIEELNSRNEPDEVMACGLAGD